MKQQTLQLHDQTLPRKGSLAYQITKKQIYGGSLTYRKLERPLSTNKAIHTVLRMNDIAYKKSGGFRNEAAFVNKKILTYAEKFNIKLYKHSINSNHIHIICKLNDKKDLGRFLRALSGALGLYFSIKFKIKGLWQGRPFTRLITWGREFKAVCKYIFKNFKEVVGFVSYTPRNHNYSFIEKWASTG